MATAVKGILFDLYGTLIDIRTNETRKDIFRTLAHYLTYQGVYLHRADIRDRYNEIMKTQKEERQEEYPEIDVEAIWNLMLLREGIASDSKRQSLSRILAQIYRGISRERLRLYPAVKKVLEELKQDYRLAAISDAQPCYVFPEMKALGLDGYFDPIIISAPYGFRKPDRRMFELALSAMDLSPGEAVHVGNDLFRDVYGAKRLGIRTIFMDFNQEQKSDEKISPDYSCLRFPDLLDVIQQIC